MATKGEEKQVKPDNYKTEKDFTTEADALLETIRDLKTDWKKRMDALNTIKRIVVGNASAKYVGAFDSFMLKCVGPVSVQILDLRSAIAKEACSAVETMATELRNSFEQAAERYVTSGCLLKLILSGNKILAETGHHAILTILQNVVSSKLLGRIADEMKGKNPLLRGKCSLYIHCILSNYPTTVLEKNTNTLEDLIKIAINEASAETRATGRDCYLLYSQLFATKAAALHATFSAAVQKAIAETSSKQSTQTSSGKSSGQKMTPVKRGPRRPAQKETYLGEDIPKAMYNSWKEGTDSAESKSGRSASSKRKQQSLHEMPQTVPVTLAQVKPAEADPPEEQAEGGEWAGHLGLGQGGLEEQKGEEMASSIDECQDQEDLEPAETTPALPLSQLLANAKLDNAEKKKAAIEEMGRILQNDERILEPEEFHAIMETLVDNATSNHYKISQDALQGIGNAIVIYTKSMQNYIEQLAPKILFTMSDKREPVTNASNFVFQLMHTNYGPDKLMPAFIKCLEPHHIMRIKAGALEVMNMLIKESTTFFAAENNVKLCAQKASQLIDDNYKNKKIVLPALGVLLALRDKDFHTTIETMLAAPSSQLSKIKSLAHDYAKDLEDNIDSFRPSPHGSASKTPNSATKLGAGKRKEGSAERKPESAAGTKAGVHAGKNKSGSSTKLPSHKPMPLSPEHSTKAAKAGDETVPKRAVKEAWVVSREEAKSVKNETKEDMEDAKEVTRESRRKPSNDVTKDTNTTKDKRISVKTTKTFPKKSSSPPPRASIPQAMNEVQFITKTLGQTTAKQHTREEVEKLTKAVSKASSAKVVKGFWEKMMPKIVPFIFSNTVFSADESLQELGFDALAELSEHQPEFLVLDNLIENLAKCYIFPKKTWELVNKVCNTLAEKFSHPKLILTISEMMPSKEPPVLQAFIHALSNIIRTASLGELNVCIDKMIKPLFIAINHENADVRKTVVFCLVEVYAVMGEEFEKYLKELSASQIKLIKIYLNKKTHKTDS